MDPPGYEIKLSGTIAKVPCKTGGGLQFEKLQGWVVNNEPITEQTPNCKTHSVNKAIKALCVVSAIGFVWFGKDLLYAAAMTDTRSNPSRQAIEAFDRARRISQAKATIGLGVSTTLSAGFCSAWGTYK